jgi:hypothetical protein
MVEKLVDRFVERRLRTLQLCANRAVRAGNVDRSCCLALPTLFGPDTCSADDLARSGYMLSCGELTPACAAVGVTDPPSFNACLECHLSHALNCMVATSYAISAVETARCFTE